MLRSLGQRPVTGSDEDPRVAELRTAVSRLRRELATHPAEFPDRGIAEDELAALAAMVAGGVPETPRLRRSLLLIAGSIGSVSALATRLADVRNAVDLFGEPRARTVADATAVPPSRPGLRPASHPRLRMTPRSVAAATADVRESTPNLA